MVLAGNFHREIEFWPIDRDVGGVGDRSQGEPDNRSRLRRPQAHHKQRAQQDLDLYSESPTFHRRAGG